MCMLVFSNRDIQKKAEKKTKIKHKLQKRTITYKTLIKERKQNK
jgi:hypothetical protein